MGNSYIKPFKPAFSFNQGRKFGDILKREIQVFGIDAFLSELLFKVGD